MKNKGLVFATTFLLSCLGFSQRLPQMAVPDNYVLTFTPNFDNDTFAGQETIQIKVLKPTNNIVLNATEIHFQDVSIASAGTTQKAQVSLEKEDEMVSLKVDKPLQPGSATIQIRYQGILNNQLRGFYLGKLEDGKKYAVTQFEATDARRAFPSFDEPAYKATFDITIIADKGLTAISNGKILADAPGPAENKHTVHFATTAKMSTYLVAMAVGDFEYIEGSSDGIPIRVYGPPGSKPNSKYALRMAEECVHYYDQYFGIKYRFQKLDMIGLPDFAAGAMENTGLITYREAMLQIDDQHASVRKHKDVAVYIAHEIAHQWFGDLVTMKWWDDIWLNEGFATWMESKAVGALRPEWNMNLDEVRDTIDALNLDSLQNTRPIHQSAETPAQIQELFDGIAYDKAGAVLRMVESYLGPDTFRAGVDEYLRKYSYSNAAADDFWSTLTSVSKKPVDQVMASFVKQPGAPMVTLDLHCDKNSAAVTLSQHRYFYDENLFRENNDQLWDVPVCMKESAGPNGNRVHNQCVLLNKKEETFPVPSCAPWVFADAGASGYYRSGYETEMLRAMSRDLESQLTPAERIMLLGNAWASVRVARQQIGDFLALAEGLQSDRNRAVMSQLSDQIDYISAHLVNSNDRESFELWVRRLLAPVARDLGWESKPGEDDEQKALRARVMQTLGSAGRDPQVIERAQTLTQEALQRPASVDRTLEKTVFALAAQNGDAALYDKFMPHLSNATTREEYYLYLGTLTQFSDPKLLERTLQYAMTDVRMQDRLGVIAGVLQNPAGQAEAWNFVRAHWSELDKVGSGYISGELVEATSAFCEPQLREEVKDFFSTHKVPVAERTLQQSLERINYCMDLKAQQGPQLAAWLQQRGAASGQ
jgi:aminopeptidase N